jgi:Transglycosylase SLT domain
MFFFTTPSSTPQTNTGENFITRSLRNAAQATGTSFDYLMRTAKRESNLNPTAKAPTSSATGLFQFIEQTWLGLVKQKGPQLGLEQSADQITRDTSGRYQVPDDTARRRILQMREDPAISAKLAGVFTQNNRETLQEKFGRTPSSGELYIAHFLGAQGATEMISQAKNNPDGLAIRSFPDAALSNRSIFFDDKGRARTNREVYARLVAFHEGPDATPAPLPPPNLAQADPLALATRSPLAIAPKTMTQPRPGQLDNAFHGLYRGGADTNAAQALRKTWLSFAEDRVNKNAPSFFPRETTIRVAAAEITAPTTTLSDAVPEVTPIAFEAPLPPMRPPSLGGRVEPGTPLNLSPVNVTRR